MEDNKKVICRGCKAEIKSKPVLKYENMPSKAQMFPTEAELSEDFGVDFEIYKCEKCDLLQISGEPVSYYRDVIRASGVSDEMREYRVSYFKEFIEKYDLDGKKIVEIGAGNGEFMNYVKLAGGNIFGIEHSKESVKKCVEEGFEIEEGFVGEHDFMSLNGPFDVFIIMNFLEHIPEPRAFMEGLNRNLNDGAIGLIEVPNTDMIIKNNMFSEFMLDHLLYFTENTLTRFLENNGFDVLESKVVWHDYCLCAIVKKRCGSELGTFYDRQKKITEELNVFVDAYVREGKKVAVWGAGHQALALMAMSGIAKKIEYVIDSAKFKQNRYTPGSHCLVVSPDEPDDRPVDAILVMAASYSDEVSGIIKKRYPKVDISIFRETGLEKI